MFEKLNTTLQSAINRRQLPLEKWSLGALNYRLADQPKGTPGISK